MSTEVANYTVVATGETAVVTNLIALGTTEVEAVVKVFDAVNAKGTGNYEPNLWLWAGKAPKHDDEIGERRPVNTKHFYFRRWEDVGGTNWLIEYQADGEDNETRTPLWSA